MLGVIRRTLGLGGAMLALALFTGTTGATAAEGPRLAYGQWGPGALSVSLLSADPVGMSPEVIFRGHSRTSVIPLPFMGPSWFPDGSALAFVGLSRGKGGAGGPGLKIFTVGVDGGAPSPVAGTTDGLAPVVSPDGGTIAFTRFRERTIRSGTPDQESEVATSIWIVELATGKRRRLTPWRYGVDVVASGFTPDGGTLAYTRAVGSRDFDVMAMALDGGGSTVLIHNAGWAVFSPDGGEIAYVRFGRRFQERDRGRTTRSIESDLFATSLDGSAAVQLTHSPRRLEIHPAWDPSGERLAFVQFGKAKGLRRTLGMGNAIFQVNADGTCRTKTLSWPDAAVFGPAWQPGPGREAGRIAC